MSYSPGPDLDLSFLYEIADGSDEFIVDSIALFLTHTPELLNNIDEAIVKHDWESTASAAHKLKSNLGFFGMPLSQALILEIEIMGKSGAPDPQALESKFNEVKRLVSINLSALANIKAEKEAGL
ncbi:MAG: Hpt domain-containing protein [Bacteroidota bacterium]|nr:Hpt domain-containing protein [Bacteroidota bacterium]